MAADIDAQLDALSADLLRELRRPLGPDDGAEAFECHQLLAIRVHRAARLYSPQLILRARQGERGVEGKGWNIYFNENWPKASREAELLWKHWRTPLLKDASPGVRVTITHGQRGAHFRRDTRDRLIVDLESMWEGFEGSVARMLDRLRKDAARRDATLVAWTERQWRVEQVTLQDPVFGALSTVAASATSMAAYSTFRQPPPNSR